MATKSNRSSLSYAVLGLLSLRSMNAYELVQGYQRSLGQVMHRSDAAIYAEPRRLERDGLVAHDDDERGRRTVPVYSITEAGRTELAAWLRRPHGFPQVDAEPLLRVVFGDPHDPTQLRAAVAAFRDEVVPRLAVARGVVAEYEHGAGPYQYRAPVVAMSGRFVIDLFTTYVAWCDWALAAIDSWSGDPAAAGRWADEAFAAMAEHLDHIMGA